MPLALKITSEKIQSARAVVFLMDEQGRMVGTKTDWDWWDERAARFGIRQRNNL